VVGEVNSQIIPALLLPGRQVFLIVPAPKTNS